MNKISKRIFIVIVAIVTLTSLASIALTLKYNKMSAEQLKAIAENRFENEDMARYKFSDKDEGNSIERFTDRDGKSIYIYKNYDNYSSFLLYILLLLSLSLLIIYYLTRYYNRKSIESAVKPIEKMTKIITEILSGGSSESDMESVYRKIEPLIMENGINRKDIEDSIKNLIESERRRREFTANVTHELKTPLTSINGYAEMIASGHAEEEDIKKFSNIILNEGNRLLKLINEILRLSEYDNSRQDKEEFERLNITKLAREIVEDMGAYAKSKKINLEFSGEKVFVMADKKMIQDMIINLVSNAIKYNYPGGNVYMSIEEKGGNALIKVRDDGIGISKVDCERIFERFYIVNHSGLESSGTGLGLALVKHIVKIHGGKIGVKSKLGRGSIFTVEIPGVGEEKN